MSKIEISICIVAFKAEKDLKQCLTSIYAFPPSTPYEVIVVDNNVGNSKVPGILKKYPNAKYVHPFQNRGYGAGNNAGLSVSSGEFALILNPDTKVMRGTIDLLYTFLKQKPKAAIAGPQLVSSSDNTSVQEGTHELTPIRGVFALSFINKFWPNNPFSRKYFSKVQKNKNTRVHVVPGSAFLIRVSAFRDVGGFDENIFLYFEESDLGRRLQKKGWESWILHKAKVLHYWGKSTESVQKPNLKYIFNYSRFYYFRKHFGILPALIVESFARFGRREAAILFVTVLGLILVTYLI